MKESAITKNITKLRERLGYTQEEVAGRLGISRQSYILVEQGKRELDASEIETLATLYGVTVAELFNEPRNCEKFKQMYFYILKCLPDGVPKTKLAKLLYLIDFRNFYEELESMSGVQYVRRAYGPVADIFFEMTDDLNDKGEISVTPLDYAFMIKSNKFDADESQLSAAEKKKIKEVCDLWRDKNTQEIVEYTHQQKPWGACLDGEYIPYSLITQEDPRRVYQPVA
jgi:transcriptional regulator with XRE-family HTH domain